MAANRVWRCHYCRSTLPFATFKKNRQCPTCGSDLHACHNCEHFDESRSTKCREPQSEWVNDRTTQNDCAYFEMRQIRSTEASQTTSSEMHSEADRAKEAFKALFRHPNPS